jgi:hypothetical protein
VAEDAPDRRNQPTALAIALGVLHLQVLDDRLRDRQVPRRARIGALGPPLGPGRDHAASPPIGVLGRHLTAAIHRSVTARRLAGWT